MEWAVEGLEATIHTLKTSAYTDTVTYNQHDVNRLGPSSHQIRVTGIERSTD